MGLAQEPKSADVRVARFGHALSLGINNSQPEEPAVHGDCKAATDSSWVLDREQRLIGITVPFCNHPANKASTTNPERSCRDHPKLEQVLSLFSRSCQRRH